MENKRYAILGDSRHLQIDFKLSENITKQKQWRNMSNIKLVSHEEFPEDAYTKELAYLEIDDKYRVAYVRKQSKNGGMFWTVGTISVTKDGGLKTYYEAFMQDSSFLERDIKTFLDSRPWDIRKTVSKVDEELPF
ncbi:MAG: hypothetical protein ACH349_01345 [Candidatus Rhabdochlamydia sp.]